MSFYKNEIFRGDLDIRKGLKELKCGIQDVEKGLCEMESGIFNEFNCGCYSNCYHNNCHNTCRFFNFEDTNCGCGRKFY